MRQGWGVRREVQVDEGAGRVGPQTGRVGLQVSARSPGGGG